MTEKIRENKDFLKDLAKLGIPIALQSLLSISITLVNTFMVGRLGDDALSGVYMGNQIKVLLTVFLAGAEGAVLALGAQYHGKSENQIIARLMGIAAVLVCTVSFMLTTVSFFASQFTVGLFTDNTEIIDAGANYLRILSLSFPAFALTQVMVAALKSAESPKVGFAAAGISLFINIISGYVLVFGRFGAPKMGAIGAAAATVIAHFAELLFVAIYILFVDKKLDVKLGKLFRIFKFDTPLMLEFFKYGSPIILGQLLWGGNILFASAVMGREGKTAVTAMSIAGTLLNISHIVTTGTAGALGIIIGKLIGEGNLNKAKRFAKISQLIFIIIGGLTACFLFTVKSPFISIYGVSEASADEASKFITVLSIVTFATCYQSAALNGILKSAKDTHFVFAVELCSVFFILLPLTLASVRLDLPAWAVFVALKSDQPIKCIPAAIRVNKFKWLKNKKDTS